MSQRQPCIPITRCIHFKKLLNKNDLKGKTETIHWIKNWNKLNQKMDLCQMEQQKIQSSCSCAATQQIFFLQLPLNDMLHTKGIFFSYSITSQNPRYLRPHSVQDAWKISSIFTIASLWGPQCLFWLLSRPSLHPILLEGRQIPTFSEAPWDLGCVPARWHWFPANVCGNLNTDFI